MITDKEHKRHLKQFHKLSDRHILAVETDMPYSDALKVVAWYYVKKKYQSN